MICPVFLNSPGSERISMKRTLEACCVAVCLVGLFTVSAPAGDTDKSHDVWPQWRGPHRDGASTEKGLLQQWKDDGPPLAWKTKGLGEGYASIAIADGKIYTMGKRRDAVYLL